MRWNRMFIICAFAVVFMALSCACAEADEVNESAFVMPSALRVIEEGAFENTAPALVYLSDSVEYLGDRAFADMPNLKAICIPESTHFIAENAFAGLDQLVIIGLHDSYAHGWAIEHGFEFIHFDVWLAGIREHGRFEPLIRPSVAHGRAAPDLDEKRHVRWFEDRTFDTDPKSRAEMYPIEYDFP